MSQFNYRKYLTLMSVTVMLQPVLLNVEAITTIQTNETVTTKTTTEKPEQQLTTRETIIEKVTDTVSKEEQSSNEGGSSSETQVSTEGGAESQSSEGTEGTTITSETTGTSDTVSETASLTETDSQTKETKESEKNSEGSKATTTSSNKTTETTEDELTKREKADEKERMEAYAKYPEKPTHEILNSVPTDISTLDGVFDTESAGQISSNTAHIETANNGGDVVFMTDSEKKAKGGQASALWSFDGAKVNMNKPFNVEMYVYLGNSRLGSADGMSLTFHNDPRNTKSIGKTGGALGVYGDIDTKRKPSKGSTGWGKPSYGDAMEQFVKEGVQNSFAIEMDTNANALFDAGEGWSGFSKRQHVMLSYPSQTDFSAFEKEKFIGLLNTGRWKKKSGINQYGMVKTGWFEDTYRPYIYNKAVGTPLYQSSDGGIISTGSYLANGKWHTLKLQYTPKDRKSSDKKVKVDAPEFRVTFDGNTRDYTGRFAPFANGLVTEEDPYMYWGMTASTGAIGSTQAVAFKKIPKTVGVDHNSDIKKNGTTIVDMDAEDYTHVKSGDELSYETVSRYMTGKAEFQDPVFSETINKQVELVPGSLEVMENGSDDFVTVPEGDYQVADNVLTYQLSKNLSVNNRDFKTRFKVKVKPTFYETQVTEESELTTATEQSKSTEDLTYIIDPMTVPGKVTLEQLSDNLEFTKTIKGKITLPRDFKNQQLQVKLEGDQGVKDLPEVAVTLDARAQGTFEVPYKTELTADNHITATAATLDKTVVAVGQTQVIDKTAPTAEKEPMDYFLLSREPSKIPFSALQLLSNVEDSNPSLETTDGEDPDISAQFLNERVIKKGLTKLGQFNAEIELKDRYNNKRTLTVPVTVVKSRLMIKVKDSEVYLADIATRKNGKNVLKDEATVKEIVTTESEIEVSYIELNGAKTVLEPEDFDLEGNRFEINGKIQPQVGKYPLVLSVAYNIYDEGVDKPVTVSDAKDFNLTVIDGALAISGSGDLAAETEITTKVEDISLKEAVKITVNNTNFETDSWQLEAKAQPFINGKGRTGYPLSLIYVDRESKKEFDLTADSVVLDNSTKRLKNYVFSEMGKNNYFKIRTGKSTSKWATVGDTYQTTIDWNLVGTTTNAMTISDQLTVKGHGGK